MEHRNIITTNPSRTILRVSPYCLTIGVAGGGAVGAFVFLVAFLTAVVFFLVAPVAFLTVVLVVVFFVTVLAVLAFLTVVSFFFLSSAVAILVVAFLGFASLAFAVVSLTSCEMGFVSLYEFLTMVRVPVSTAFFSAALMTCFFTEICENPK